MNLIKPQALQRGDNVALLCPSGRPANPSQLLQGKCTLEELGFRVLVGKHALNRYGDFAGTDEERLADFHEAWANPEVKALIACRGGNGAIRLLPRIDYDLIRNNPKLFMGASDITGFHLAIHKKTGLVTLHGTGAEFMKATRYTYEIHKRALTSRLPLGEILDPVAESPYPPPSPPCRMVISEGRASGPLIGGNLTLIAQTMGTPYEIDTKDAILFLEDVQEEPHILDSMLTQLSLAGKFRAAAGIMVGAVVDGEPQGAFLTNFSFEELLQQHLGDLGIPVIYGLRLGHTKDKCVLPIGVQATFEAMGEEVRVMIEEAACQ